MIVIPMAGLSSRFSRAGYDVPKWMLPVGSRSLLEWSLMSFEELFKTEEFLIIHLDSTDVSNFVCRVIQRLGIKSFETVGLPSPTRGQAETVFYGLQSARFAASSPLTIFNIDTIRPGYRPDVGLATCDGWLECFYGKGDHWSFVRPDAADSGIALEVREKRRISSLCCTGLYYFRSADVFSDYYERESESNTMNELYVAPLYQRMIEARKAVRFGVVQDAEVFFSGTPVEYEELLKRTEGLERAFNRGRHT